MRACGCSFWRQRLCNLLQAPTGPYDSKPEKAGGCFASPGLWRLLLLLLGVVGVAIWGLVESIQSTNTTISTFW